MKVIVGLGNPGKAYARSRHNLGFMSLDAFAQAQHAPEWKTDASLEAETTSVHFDGNKIMLAKPQTYMNESGRSVQKILVYYKLSPADLIVVYDDIDLAFCKMRIAMEGGAGGHNGVQSVIQSIGTKEFTRLKLGVRTGKRDRVAADKFVLEPFGLLERGRIKKWLPRIAEAIACLISEDAQTCMNRFH